MNNEKSKQIYDDLISSIKDDRQAAPQTLAEILEEQDNALYRNAVLCQVLLFICCNLWEKQYGTKLTKEKLHEIQKAVLRTK